MHLLDKLQGWVQNGPMGNDLQRNSGFFGMGHTRGSKLGTIRRVGDIKGGPRSKWMPEGTSAASKRSRDWAELDWWEDQWRDPYLQDKETEMEGIAWNIGGTQEDPIYEGDELDFDMSLYNLYVKLGGSTPVDVIIR